MRRKIDIEGILYQIRWGNPYTDPPAGAPRVLAEVFMRGRQPPPAEYKELTCSLGGGYSHYIYIYDGPPPRRLSPETLANVRRKRLERRIKARFPMFADEFIEQAIAQKPDYYAGITDPEIAVRVDEMLQREWQLYHERIGRSGVVIIYATEPPECKVAANRIATELKELTRK